MERLPQFYDPGRTGTLFQPDMALISAEATGADLPPAANDRLRTHLLIVDMQVDFCHSTGTLYVPGALDDLRRLIRFIYRQAEYITNITCSLDSHLPLQIFHPGWWTDGSGRNPPPFTIITCEDVENGKWRPLLEPEWSVQYTRRLQEQAKKQLTVWPYHCLVGSPGQLLDPQLFSAVVWHSLARNTQPDFWVKGSIPKTEFYSIVQPEIEVPEHPQGGKNRRMLDLLRKSDRLFIAGEAKSHCVLETVEDLVEEFSGQPELLQRMYVLQDCTSSIAHPAVDYETIANQRFADFAKLGVHLVSSAADSFS